MHVFLSDTFYKFSLAPIFKKLDAFIPALSLLLNDSLLVFVFVTLQQNQQRIDSIPTPVCFFLLYYIYSKHMFLSNGFYVFDWRQFSKSWTPSFLPYPCSVILFYFCYCFLFSTKNKAEIKKWYQPLCVSFYYIILLITKCILLKIIFRPPKNQP